MSHLDDLCVDGTIVSDLILEKYDVQMRFKFAQNRIQLHAFMNTDLLVEFLVL